MNLENRNSRNIQTMVHSKRTKDHANVDHEHKAKKEDRVLKDKENDYEHKVTKEEQNLNDLEYREFSQHKKANDLDYKANKEERDIEVKANKKTRNKKETGDEKEEGVGCGIIKAGSMGGLTSFLHFYNAFMCLWLAKFFHGVGHVTLSGIFAQYYFTVDKRYGMPNCPLLISLQRCCRY